MAPVPSDATDWTAPEQYVDPALKHMVYVALCAKLLPVTDTDVATGPVLGVRTNRAGVTDTWANATTEPATMSMK
jgi:hypothetical protein